MREILFRGKCEYNDKWYYGFLYKDCFILEGDCNDDHGDYRSDDKETWIDTYMYCVDNTTVGQYTGLKDKNGKNIYEGDIVSVFSDCDGYYVKKGYLDGVVIYDDEYFFDYQISFNHIRNCCQEYLGNHRNDIEVIGNIYDNPELLSN